MSENTHTTDYSYLLNRYTFPTPVLKQKELTKVIRLDATAMADYSLSLILLLSSAPVFLLSAIWVACVVKGNPLFIQNRIGLHGKIFRIIKLKTMQVTGKSKEGEAQFCRKGDKRIIKGGNFLRKTRIDEIPQFFNILMGDMALVGPRPEQGFFVEEFKSTIENYDLRHTHKPGLTGLAQVRLGYVDSRCGTRKKLKYDLLYIRQRNLKTWLYVVIQTVGIIVKQAGR